MVMGAPTSLLNEARAATVGPTRSSTVRSRFLVVVLPFDPVTPTMRSLPSARTRRDDLGREGTERVDRVGDDDLGHRELERVLDDEQGRALVGRRGSETMPVVELAALGDEDAARGHLARVGRDRARDDRLRRGIGAVEVQRAARGRRDLGQGERDHSSHPASRSACFESSRAE